MKIGMIRLEKNAEMYSVCSMETFLVPIALKRYHCSVVSGTNVALRAVPLVAL